MVRLAGVQQPLIQRRDLMDMRSTEEPLLVGELQIPSAIAAAPNASIPALTIGASMMEQTNVTQGEGVAATLGRDRLSHGPRLDLAGILSAPVTFAVAHDALENLDTSNLARREVVPASRGEAPLKSAGIAGAQTPREGAESGESAGLSRATAGSVAMDVDAPSGSSAGLSRTVAEGADQEPKIHAAEITREEVYAVCPGIVAERVAVISRQLTDARTDELTRWPDRNRTSQSLASLT